MTNPLQPLDPIGAPDPVTPADSPSSPSGFAGVTPHGRGPAPYDIQAPLMDGEITTAFNGANAASGAGVLYAQSGRQAETERLLSSPQGYGTFSITGGSSGGGGEDWPSDVRP